MTFQKFVTKHFGLILRGLAAIVLASIVAAFIFAFNRGALPHSEDGDAFDTIYAIDSADADENI